MEATSYGKIARRHIASTIPVPLFIKEFHAPKPTIVPSASTHVKLEEHFDLLNIRSVRYHVAGRTSVKYIVPVEESVSKKQDQSIIL